MTQQKAEPSAGAGCLGLIVLILAGTVIAYYGLGWGQRKSPTIVKAPITHSALLDADLPGAQPFQTADRRERVLNAARELARSYDMPCTTNEELYVLTDDITALDALNRTVQSGWERKNLNTVQGGVTFALSGPRDLLVFETDNALFICET